MFSLQKPRSSSIEAQLKRAALLPVSYPELLNTEAGLVSVLVPFGFALDHTRSEIGNGLAAFEAAKTAMQSWLQFALGWVQVANIDAQIKPGELVAVQALALGLWSVNISRILYVIDDPHRFGFGYGTTPMHIERGEERFLVEFDEASGVVFYDLLAVSQPASWLVWLGYPFARRQQSKFARGSHLRLKRAVQSLIHTETCFGENGH
jgi:uncharacterized protein (UPF0548 family)